MTLTISESAANPDSWLDGFRREGYIGPVAAFDPAECWQLLLHIRETERTNPRAWYKNLAAVDPRLYRFATTPDLVSIMRTILGQDVVLFRAHVVTRAPGESHPWHTDAEAAIPGSRSVNVWIGLDNVSSQASFQLIAGSHRVGKSVQQLRHEHGRKREDTTTGDLLGWAQERVTDARHVCPDMTDGDAIIADGRTWHSTDNLRLRGRRSALVLQYTTGDTAVRKQDESHWDWPIGWIEKDWPPVISVSGTASRRLNNLVSAPRSLSRRGPLSTVVVPIDRPLGDDVRAGWKARHLFDGCTSVFEKLNCHVSVLSPGHCPHPPHSHPREELLIVLDGEAEIVIAESPSPDPGRVETLAAGEFSYYPAGQHHTIRNAGTEPVTYLMLDWATRPIGATEPLEAQVVRPPSDRQDARGDFVTDVLMEGPTGMVRKLHCHLTTLQAGCGYRRHTDPYDVAIVPLSGRIRTGRRALESGIAFFPAGQPHGMRNIGDRPARYLVMEFHGASLHRFPRLRARLRRTWPFARRHEAADHFPGESRRGPISRIANSVVSAKSVPATSTIPPAPPVRRSWPA